MPDLIIRRLERMKEDAYVSAVFSDVIDDTLAMLKKQEAVNPIAKEDDTYECICGAIVGWDELDVSGMVQTRLNYCPFCGRAVKW